MGRQTDPKLIKRLRASQKQHAINVKATAKLADDEGAPVTRDLWASDDENKMEDDEDDDDDPIAFHNKITKVTRVNVPNSRDAMKRKASQYPAVPVTYPGASYNPDLGQYLSHLGAANKVEEDKLKEEQKLVRELDAKFPDREEAKKLESNWLIEMSGGLAEDADKEEDAVEEDSKDVDPATPLNKKEKR